jgi:hypothetical protein
MKQKPLTAEEKREQRLEAARHRTRAAKLEAKKARGEPLPPKKPFGFQKGNPGKPRGRLTAMKYRVKEAVLEAAAMVGRDGKGKDEMVGYLAWLARTEPAVFGRMLEKIMPTQHEIKDMTKKRLTPGEAAERLRMRGIPVPPLLLDMVANKVGESEARRDREDDEAEAARRGMDFVDHDAGLGADQDVIDVTPVDDYDQDQEDDDAE